MIKVKGHHWVISIVSLIVFGLIAMFYTYTLEEALTMENKIHMGESSSNAAKLISQKNSSNFEVLRTTRSCAADFENLDDEKKLEILEEACRQNSFYSLGYADIYGKAITSDGNRVNIAEEKYFKDALNGNNAISEVITSDKSYLGNYIVYSIPVYKENKIEAVLYGIYETENIYSINEFKQVNGGTDGYIVETSGKIIEASEPHIIKKDLFATLELGEANPSSEQLRQSLNKDESGVFKYTADTGEKKYISYAPVFSGMGDQKLKVVTVASPETEFKKSNDIINKTMCMTGLITLLFAFIIAGILYSKEANRKRLEKVAYYDDLCSIMNQNGFVKAADEMLKTQKEKLAFAYIDIDNFKAINNLFTYQYGNEILIKLSRILEETFGGKGIVGRFSGDNFAVLSEYEEEEAFTEKINKLQKSANIQGHNKKEIMLVTGIYFVKNNQEQFNQVFDKANIAKHRVRHMDILRYSIYDEEVGRLMQEEDMLIEEIKKALQQDDFDVYYQPKFDFSTKCIMASEALIRWEHRELGFISPAKFIPIAEKTHLIVGIGHFVFERVCSDIRNWISLGIKPLPVSVNFSRIEILQGGMIEFIEATVEKYDISYDLLEIEITETIAVSDYEKIETTLNEIKRLGMMISIDDFGAGYSSLGCLKKLNVDTLKIDRSLIMDLEDNTRGNNILKCMIDLSKKLELKTICEGIETEEQMKLLELLDCDYGQGFIFARPMKESEFRKKLSEKNF